MWGVRYQLLKQKRHRDTNEKKEERGGKNALEAHGGHFCGPLRALPPHPPTESGRKSNLKHKHTQTHTNKYRDSNNHKSRNLSHNFPKESKTDQQTRKAKLSVMMMLRLVWVSFHYFLLFFLFPGLLMNEDSDGLVRGNFFFGWLGFYVCLFWSLFFFGFLFCFGMGFFSSVVFDFPSNGVLREALAMGLVCAWGTVRAEQGPGAEERPP